MIIVTGVNGRLGRAIVESLIARGCASEVVGTCRDPEKASDLARRGVTVRRGDFADPSTLPSAFEGASQLLVVSSDARRYGGDPQAQHRAAIEAAKAAGVKRVVYTSHMAAGERSQFPPMHEHAATERMLEASGLAWTALRNGFYASSALLFMGDAKNTGRLSAPVDGKVSWTTHQDLADAAAAILVDEGRFEGPTPPLVGSEALDLGELAEAASIAWGRPVQRSVVTEEELRAGMASAGVPRVVIDISVGFYRAARAGELVAVDPTLPRLLGRATASVRSLL